VFLHAPRELPSSDSHIGPELFCRWRSSARRVRQHQIFELNGTEHSSLQLCPCVWSFLSLHHLHEVILLPVAFLFSRTFANIIKTTQVDTISLLLRCGCEWLRQNSKDVAVGSYECRCLHSCRIDRNKFLSVLMLEMLAASKTTVLTWM